MHERIRGTTDRLIRLEEKASVSCTLSPALLASALCAGASSMSRVKRSFCGE